MVVRTEGRGGIEERDNSVRCMMDGSTCRTLRAISPTYKTMLVRVDGIGAPYPVPLTAVKALVRWATGKRLTNRLPNLSLITLGTWYR